MRPSLDEVSKLDLKSNDLSKHILIKLDLNIPLEEGEPNWELIFKVRYAH